MLNRRVLLKRCQSRRKGMVCMHKMEGLAFTLNDETEKLSMNVSR